MSSDESGHGMWRELRSWPLYAQIGVVAFAAAAIALGLALPAIHSGLNTVDRSAWPEGELPDAEMGATVAVDEPARDGPALPDGVAAYDGEPLWSEPSEGGDQVAHVDPGTLVLVEGSLRLETDDRTAWEYTWDSYRAEVGLAGGTVIVSSVLEGDDSWPSTQDTVALDLETGEEVWRDRDASFVTVFSDTLLMTECTGEQDDRIGDCTLHARNPADLSLRWSTPTYASARVISPSPWTGRPMPEPVLVESFPTGHGSRTVTAYGGDGAELHRVRTDGGAIASEGHLIVYDHHDRNPADGCTAHLTGYAPGGDPQWELEAALAVTDDLRYCGDLPGVVPQDGKLALTVDGLPAVVDLTDGEPVWSAPTEGRAMALGPDADVLVAADWEAEEDNLRAYDTETGDELWRSTASLDADTPTSVTGSTLWIHGGDDQWGWRDYGAFGYRLGTGEVRALPGAVAYTASGEIVTRVGDHDDAELQAWPADLWE
ncbi:outer membrane protein assembly factor BamB family protein [Glycomyces xiaoerkulensis]|uniref:outer membrane protein assembly factor BamB family protein n=1 Tax=Glycomyces xiaoerkulensis TaxID=2038139 RepID=UPI000C25A094|nr:PQQ-binding-like beta-propeller repeat protein [Glycomyces xiaoerkulensis]